MKKQRYLLIWLSLFLPTVTIGVIAMGLLAREQARVDELNASSHKARAQTIADNADLIMAEIKTGVLLTLEAASGSGSEAARLRELSKTNPLINTTYIWTPTSTGEYSHTFSDTNDAHAWQSLIDIHAPPWGNAISKQKQVTLEVKQKNAPISTFKGAGSSSSYSYSNAQSKRANIREFSQYNVQSINTLKQEERAIANDMEQIAEPPIHQTGWVNSNDSPPTWIAWYQQLKDGRVTGAKLETDIVLAQLQQAFPDTQNSQITYHLKPPDQSSSYQDSLSITSNRIPLGVDLLGWHLSYTTSSNSSSHSLLLLGGLLVAILCTTNLGAGTLILWRARTDARDSAQKSTFVSNVSHELRTPLTTIRMYAEMLEERRIEDPSKQQRYLNTITNESQRLTRLIDNVLDFSHLSQGRKRYQMQEVNIVDLIQTVIDSQEPRLSEAGMTPIWNAPNQTQKITSDCDAIEQVLLNLIDNAIKYANTGKTLEFQLNETSSGIEISITDNGPGIAPSDRKKIFNAFQRLDESLTSNQPGSGLGLSICQGIIKDLSGNLKLSSTIGKGSCFTIQLPHVPKHAAS